MPNPLQKFLIAPLQSGMQTNVKPWIIGNDAYAILRNAYTWRGRVKKRVGARVMDQSKPPAVQQQFTRLRLQVTTTDGFGDIVGNIPNPGAAPAIGQMFSIGNDYFTVSALGNPAPLLATNPATLGIFDTTIGAFVFSGATPLTAVYFYPSTPVMALQLYNQIQINDEITIAFDRNFSYQYINGFGWQRSGVATQGLWSGTDSQFHWTTNWRGVSSSSYLMYVVNNNVPDGIQYFDGLNWATLAPPVLNAGGDTLLTSLIVVPFKYRLLFLNVTQNVVGTGQRTFAARVVFSWNQNPLDVNAFRQDIVGNGSFIDIPTKEAIISCEFLKDRLIVLCEESTWELVYTNNQVLPFTFQKINTELGVESTHSIIPFDKVTIGMGSTGIHFCSGINVQRIDDLIPYTIFDISNINSGPQRVYGIRDYYEELCYWSYPSSQQTYADSNVYPNRVLIFDYINTTWAFNDDSITAFGYFYLQDNILVWQSITSQWQNMTQEWDDFESDQLFRSVIAGNQEGWTFIIRPNLTRNSMSLQITNMVAGANVITLTIINHNLPLTSWIFISNVVDNVGDLTGVNNVIWQATYIDVNTITIANPGLAGFYDGGGTVELVSQVDIWTKQYNFFPQEGKYTFISHGDFYVDRAPLGGEITVDYYASTSVDSMITDGTASGAILGTSILETSPYTLSPFEANQDRFWHRLYFQTMGETIQLHLYFTPEQMQTPAVVFVSFELNGIIFFARAESDYF